MSGCDREGETPRKVAIVGGGLAGMAAAQALATAAPDLQLTLFESRRANGGRAGSFVDPATGEEVDYCQHVAMGCCTNLLGLLADCGLSDVWTRYDSLTFYHPDFEPSPFAASRWLPAPLHLLPTLGRLRYLTAGQKRQIRLGTWLLMRDSSPRLATQTAAQWLRDAGQSDATIRDYWDVVLVSALGEASQAVAMSAARKVFVEGFLATRGASDVCVPRLSLGELFGKRLPDSLRHLGVAIRNRTAVRSVGFRRETAEHGGLVLDLADGAIGFDQVVMAVPWHQIGKILEPRLAESAGLRPQQWGAFPASPISGVHLWFDRPITAAPHAVLVGSLAQWMFRRPTEPPLMGTDRSGHYYQVVISASRSVRQASSDQVVGQVVQDLGVAFPAARTARLLAARVVTDPQAVFSVSPAVEAARPEAATRIAALHLAGDFVRTGWPATMEGAVISGRLAAASVLRALGRPPCPVRPGLSWGMLARWLIRRDAAERTVA